MTTGQAAGRAADRIQERVWAKEEAKVVTSKSSTVPGKPASAGNGDAVRKAQARHDFHQEQIAGVMNMDAADREDERRAKALKSDNYDRMVGAGKYANMSRAERAQGQKSGSAFPKAKLDSSGKPKYMSYSRKGGSPGSGQGRGNWGHAGRPGERGGSA